MLIALLVALAVATAPPTANPSLPKAGLLETDERLQRKVSLAGPRLYLGELLETLGKQAGVSLRFADAKDPASGVELVAWMSQRPLREVMTGVSSLLSTPYDPWFWRRSGSGEQGSYVLDHSRSFAEVAAAMKRDVAKQFEDDAWTLYRAARLGPDGLRGLQTERPDLVGSFTEHGWAFAGMLGELSEGQFRTVLGGQRVLIPEASLSPQGKQYVQTARLATKGIVPRDGVGFNVYTDHVFPTLSVSAEGSHYFSTIGPISELRWRRQACAGWSDAGTEAQRKQFKEAVERSRTRGPAWTPYRPTELLRRIAERHTISVIAEVASVQGGIRGFDPAMPLDDLLVLMGQRQFPWKKVGDLYVLRRPDFFTTDRSGLVPWPEIRALRQSSEQGGGFLNAAGLMRLAKLSPPQRERLAEEFPDATSSQLSTWQPIFLAADAMDPSRTKRILSESGLAARDLSPQARRILFPPGQRPTWPGAASLAADANTVLSLTVQAQGDQRALVWLVTQPGTPGVAYRVPLRSREPLKAPGWLEAVQPSLGPPPPARM